MFAFSSQQYKANPPSTPCLHLLTALHLCILTVRRNELLQPLRWLGLLEKDPDPMERVAFLPVLAGAIVRRSPSLIRSVVSTFS